MAAACAVAVVIALVVVKIAPENSGDGLTGHHADAPFGPFLGYARIGPATAIGATFDVPRVEPGSPDGEAATWIGAQGLGPPRRFLQIGVLEGRFVPAGRSSAGDYYVAFWSDTRHGYHAVPLFPVHAGDTISAALTLLPGRWELALDDQHGSSRSGCPSEAGTWPRRPCATIGSHRRRRRR